MSTVLVTGGAGYVGSLLARELLARGDRVVVADCLLFGGESLLDLLSHPRFTFCKADVAEPSEIESVFAAHTIDAVVHLAAIVGDPACKQQPELANRTMWDGSRAVFELCEKHGVRQFLFASTCSNYGKMEGDSPVDEDSPLRPVSLYAELKVKFEQYLLERESPVDSTILRFATVYGLSQRPRFDLTVNEFARDAFLDGELEIYGQYFWRPYCHVRDIADAVMLVLDAEPAAVASRAFNVGSGKENYQKRMIADEIAKQMPVNVTYVDKQEDPRDYKVNFDRIAALGFRPRLELADGIREVAEALSNGMLGDPYSPRYRNS